MLNSNESIQVVHFKKISQSINVWVVHFCYKVINLVKALVVWYSEERSNQT